MPKRLKLYRDHENADGWSYRPDPEREPRVFVPNCLLPGHGRNAPAIIVVEGLTFDREAARPKRRRDGSTAGDHQRRHGLDAC